MKKLLLLAALVVSGAANAAELSYKAAPPPLLTWTGFYVGATAGYGWQAIIDPTSSPGAIGVPHPNGGLWGGQVGANYQFASHWVIGAEFDAAVARIEDTRAGFSPLFPTTLVSITGKVDSLAALRGRFGYDWDGTLLYVSGGPAWSQIETISAGSFSGLVVADKRTVQGWVFGGGVEKRLWSNWTVRAEYLYGGFGPYTLNTEGGVKPGVRSNLQTVMIGVNWLFH
jgi:outer membrane immunogenic protein